MHLQGRSSQRLHSDSNILLEANKMMFSEIKQFKNLTTLNEEGTIHDHTFRLHYSVGAGYKAVGVEHIAGDGRVIIQTILYAEDRFSEVLATGYQSAAHEQYGRCDAMVQG